MDFFKLIIPEMAAPPFVKGGREGISAPYLVFHSAFRIPHSAFERPATRNSQRTSSGFTLFEILITLSILAVVLSILYLTFHQSMAAMAAAEERADIVQQGRLVLERISGDLQSAALLARKEGAPGFRTGLVGVSKKDGDDFLDRLDFTTSMPLFTNKPDTGWGVTEVGYSLDRKPGVKGYTLFRRQDEAMDNDLTRGGRSLGLCDRVRSLNFVYFDKDGKRAPDWNTLEGARKNKLPSRVEIDLKLEDAGGRVFEFRTQVYIPSAT